MTQTTEEHELLQRIADVCNQIFLATGMYDERFGFFQGTEAVPHPLLNMLYNLTSDMIPKEAKYPSRE